MRGRRRSFPNKLRGVAQFALIMCYRLLMVSFLPALSGAMVGMGFPGKHFPWMSYAWLQPIALAPLFLSWELSVRKGEDAYRPSKQGQFVTKLLPLIVRGLIFGTVANTIAFWWTTQPAILFGGIPAWGTYPSFVLYAVLSSTFYLVLFSPFILELIARRSERTSRSSVFALGFICVAIEVVSPRFFFWSFGSLTHASASLNQWSSVFGFCAVSYFVICSGALLARGVAAAQRHPEMVVQQFAKVLALWILAWGAGFARLSWNLEELASAPLTHVAWVQPNFSFSDLSSNTARSPSSQSQSLENLLEISREALAADSLEPKRQLLIWPESVAPADFAWNETQLETTKAFVKETGVTLLAQGVEVEKQEIEKNGWRHAAMKSTSFLIRPDGSRSENHEKWIPIPFGESVPFEDTFPNFGRWIRDNIGNTSKVSRGSTYGALAYTADFRVAPLICFDAIFPPLARKQAREGMASIFVNQSNFVWMGDSNAGDEFMELTRFRGLENGRSLVLAANTGPSGAFDPLGRPIGGRNAILTRGFGRASLPVVTWTTLYQVWGDLPIYLMAAASLLYVTFVSRQKKHV